MATFSVRFLGCKVSHADAHAVREALLRDGHAEQEGAETRRRQHVLRHTRGGAQVAAGCRACRAHAPARVRHGLRRESRRGRVRRPARQRRPSSPGAARRRPAFVAGDVGAIGCVQADARLDRVRAFVSVQDGCSFSCNFCVIPLVRGRSRSRRAEAVLVEVRRRVGQGHREVVLTGINLGCYRDREARLPLARLVREAGETPGLARLRLSSIEVNHVGAELVRRCARRRPSRATCTCRSSPATTACCARWAAATRPRPTSAGSSRSRTST